MRLRNNSPGRSWPVSFCVKTCPAPARKGKERTPRNLVKITCQQFWGGWVGWGAIPFLWPFTSVLLDRPVWIMAFCLLLFDPLPWKSGRKVSTEPIQFCNFEKEQVVNAMGWKKVLPFERVCGSCWKSFANLLLKGNVLVECVRGLGRYVCTLLHYPILYFWTKKKTSHNKP